MSLALSKLRGDVELAMFVAAVIAVLVSALPIYQRTAYEDTPNVTYSKYRDYAGYPAGEGFPVVNSREEIAACEGNFVIEIDMDKLEGLKIYGELQGDCYGTNSVLRVLKNNEDGGVGRYFIATLGSGEQVIILLDDLTIDLPKEGVVRLPVGRLNGMGSGLLKEFREQTELSDEELEWYVDMAGDWRKSDISQKAEKHCRRLNVKVFLILCIILIPIFRILNRKKRRIVWDQD